MPSRLLILSGLDIILSACQRLTQHILPTKAIFCEHQLPYRSIYSCCQKTLLYLNVFSTTTYTANPSIDGSLFAIYSHILMAIYFQTAY